jgi:hypothetical protein
VLCLHTMALDAPAVEEHAERLVQAAMDLERMFKRFASKPPASGLERLQQVSYGRSVLPPHVQCVHQTHQHGQGC